jgi:hypothetical protein
VSRPRKVLPYTCIVSLRLGLGLRLGLKLGFRLTFGLRLSFGIRVRQDEKARYELT